MVPIAAAILGFREDCSLMPRSNAFQPNFLQAGGLPFTEKLLLSLNVIDEDSMESRNKAIMKHASTFRLPSIDNAR
jgi:hypothetical protein